MSNRLDGILLKLLTIAATAALVTLAGCPTYIDVTPPDPIKQDGRTEIDQEVFKPTPEPAGNSTTLGRGKPSPGFRDKPLVVPGRNLRAPSAQVSKSFEVEDLARENILPDEAVTLSAMRLKVEYA